MILLERQSLGLQEPLVPFLESLPSSAGLCERHQLPIWVLGLSYIPLACGLSFVAEDAVACLWGCTSMARAWAEMKGLPCPGPHLSQPRGDASGLQQLAGGRGVREEAGSGSYG